MKGEGSSPKKIEVQLSKKKDVSAGPTKNKRCPHKTHCYQKENKTKSVEKLIPLQISEGSLIGAQSTFVG